MNVNDSASFSSVATRYAGSWTKAANNRSTMTFVDCIHPFEFLVNDSAKISFTRCTDVLTWLFMPKGATGTLRLPGDTGWKYVDTFYLGPNSDSIKGITYEVTMDSTTNIWGCIPQAGCSVSVEDSRIRVMGFIFMDSIAPYRISGLKNYTYFANRRFPLPDRSVTLKNTYVMTFNLYPMLKSEVHIDSSTVGEIITYHNSHTVMNNVTVDGTGGFFGLEGGSKVTADYCVFTCALKVKDSTELKLKHSFAPLTTTVINRGRFLASNSVVNTIPDVRDSAHFLSVNIKTPAVYDTLKGIVPVVASLINKSGSAVEPFKLESYSIAINTTDSSSKLLKGRSKHLSDTVANWNTDQASLGQYLIFVSCIIDSTDTITALSVAYKVASTPAVKAPGIISYGFGGSPNPFSTALSLRLGRAVDGQQFSTVDIHDINGRLIRKLAATNGNSAILWDGKNGLGNIAPAGLYTVTVKTINGKVLTKKFMKL
ncbi:MAG: T9SS type A sorting domain-containing protein [Fibrobacteres bacterium]|nr:T9SS type A sorting domain-containing protein [Fibrobacterota bacterium]